ncbi:hypothetical protein CCP3SC1AL1_2110007 [Gammaproteobacteria bacterium]
MHYEYNSDGLLMIHHEDNGHDDWPDSLALSLFRLVLKKKKSVCKFLKYSYSIKLYNRKQ